MYVPFTNAGQGRSPDWNLEPRFLNQKVFMSSTLVLSVGFNRMLLEPRNQVLRSAGYLVVAAYSLRAAVDYFRAGDFDLVVLCHSVPQKDRESLTSLLRAWGSRIPVVSVSGKVCECDAFATETLEDGAHKFLSGISDALAEAARTSGWVSDRRKMPLPPEKRPPSSDSSQEQQPRTSVDGEPALARAS